VLKIRHYAKPQHVTSKRKERHDNNEATEINDKKVNHFDRGPTYRPYFNRTTSKPTLIADPSVFFIFPTAHFF